jgi:hypothetical protein
MGVMNLQTLGLAVFIPIAGIAVGGLSIYFGYRAKELLHRERMAAIEKGIELPPEPARGRNSYLLRGLINLSIGIGIAIFFLAIGLVSQNPRAAAVAAFGLIPIGIGIAHLVVYGKTPADAATVSSPR